MKFEATATLTALFALWSYVLAAPVTPRAAELEKKDASPKDIVPRPAGPALAKKDADAEPKPEAVPKATPESEAEPDEEALFMDAESALPPLEPRT